MSTELQDMKSELLEALGDTAAIRQILETLAREASAEMCAFYTVGEAPYNVVLLESEDLAVLTAQITEKLGIAYRMFTNTPKTGASIREHVFYRAALDNGAAFDAGPRLESFFIVPVTDSSDVRGILLFGSPRKDAFTRADIQRFRALAADELTGVVETEAATDTAMLERVLGILPFGAALVCPDGRMGFMNELFCTLLQIRRYRPETLLDIAHVSPYNLGGVWDEYRAINRNLVERELQSTDATERSVVASLMKCTGLSGECNVLVLLRDSTGQREEERLKDEMLATVAHEIRTPMTALKNSLAIILEDAVKRRHYCDQGFARTTGRKRRFLETALRTISRLEMLVDGLIDVSTFRRTNRPLDFETVDIALFLEEAVRLFAESMKKKGISFDITADQDASRVECDTDRLEQIIQNLLSNAMKTVPAGGGIRVHVSAIDTILEEGFPFIPWKYLPAPKFIDICVRDTGSGIPREVIEDINPFFGGKENRKRPRRGLGLYIARTLMRQHGGALLAERTDDGGSAVHLYLPRDTGTRYVIQAVYAMDESTDRMIDRGLSPILYTIVKPDDTPWPDIYRRWDTVVKVDPSSDEVGDSGVYLWTLGETLALALTAEKRYARSPDTLMGGGSQAYDEYRDRASGGVRTGWAVGPRDAENYTGLVTTALKRAAENHALFV
jgi:signal transduction histidine kinase